MNPNKCPKCGESLLGCRCPQPNLIIVSSPMLKILKETLVPGVAKAIDPPMGPKPKRKYTRRKPL